MSCVRVLCKITKWFGLNVLKSVGAYVSVHIRIMAAVATLRTPRPQICLENGPESNPVVDAGGQYDCSAIQFWGGHLT